MRAMVRRTPAAAVVVALVLSGGAVSEARAGQDTGPVRILLDQPPRMVDYQISRLTADELARAERKRDDARYRPIYVALLTRGGLASPVREEALAALVAMDHKTPVVVLLEALARVATSDRATADKLVGMLFAQPGSALQADRAACVAAIEQDAPAAVLRGAYGALLLGDDAMDATLALARGRAGHLVELLRAVTALPPSAERIRDRLTGPVAASVEASDPLVRSAAIEALASIRPDRATAAVLSRVIQSTDDSTRAAAVHAALAVPAPVWPADQVEPVIRAVMAQTATVPPDRRTNADVVEALQLADGLAAGLPDATRRAIRRDLRALGVQVVSIATVPEEMRFDRWWFAVEAGKPVQIVFTNRDAMPHNVLVGRPGALAAIGNAAATVPLPVDPTVKPYVPESADVLASTFLITEGETARLNFRAPGTAGEYVFLCSFPGHWARMYGVMVVVPDLEAWDAAPGTPRDPISQQPFPSARR